MTNKITDSQLKTASTGLVSLSPKKLYKSLLKKFPDVLSVPQTSDVLGVSTKTVCRLLNDGSLESLKVGRSYKIPKIFLLRYLKVIDF